MAASQTSVRQAGRQVGTHAGPCRLRAHDCRVEIVALAFLGPSDARPGNEAPAVFLCRNPFCHTAQALHSLRRASQCEHLVRRSAELLGALAHTSHCEDAQRRSAHEAHSRRRPPHSSSRLAWWPPGARFSRPPAADRGVKPAARGSRCTVARGSESWLRAAPADVIPIMSPQVSHESSSPLSRGAAPLSFRFLLPLPSSLARYARWAQPQCIPLAVRVAGGGGCGPTYCDPRSRLRGTRHRSTPWWVAPAAGGR
jgi:hypothetical protein